MKKIFVVVVLGIFVTSLLLTGCQPGPAEDGENEGAGESILLPFSGPLTGPDAADAEAAAKAYELAVALTNEAGGVCGGRMLTTKTYDTKGDAKEGTNVATMIAAEPTVLVTVSDFNSAVVLAEAPIFTDAGLAQVSYYAAAPDLPKRAGPYVFRISPAGHTQAQFIANYMINTLGIKKIAQIYANDDYGILIKDAFVASVAEFGGEIVAEEAVLGDQTDLSAVVSKIKAANPEGVAMWVQYQVASYYAKQARDMGLTAPVYAFDGIFSPEFIKLAGDAVEGYVTITAYVTTSTNPYVQAFVEAYRAKYNGEDPNNAAGYAYDAAITAINAIKGSNCEGRAAVIQWLTDNLLGKDNQGVTGMITLDENRDRAFSPEMYILLKIEGGKFVEVK